MPIMPNSKASHWNIFLEFTTFVFLLNFVLFKKSYIWNKTYVLQAHNTVLRKQYKDSLMVLE